jgi:ribosomal-protein-alanine N-acetyltransferase
MTTPESLLETERLVLRRLTPDDLDGLAALYADADVMRFYPSVRTREETARNLHWILEQYAAHPGTGLWGAVSRSENRLVGRCGLIWQTVDGCDDLEVGYLLEKAVWNRGLATEAARAIRDYAFRAFSHASRLISIIHPDNVPSQRVAQKSGMAHTSDAPFSGFLCRIYAIERFVWQTRTTTKAR